MFDFWIGSSILLCVAAIIVLWPFLSRARSQTDSKVITQQALNVAVYKDRLNELEEDRTNGLIGEEQFDTLKAELESNLLNDVSDEDLDKQAGESSSPGFPLPLLLVVLVALPLVSWALYSQWGAYNALSDSRNNQAAELTTQGAMPNVDVEELLAALQQKLNEDPDNLEGWILLGRSLMNMGRYRDAVPAFRQVAVLMERNNEDTSAVYGMIAQALFFADEGMSAGVEEAIEKALSINANEINSLGLLGMQAFRQSRYEEAIVHWQKILQVAPDHPSREAIEQGIADAQQRLGSASDSENASQISRVESEGDSLGQASISVDVDIDPSIVAGHSSDDTVFVYARAVNGPKMPLAIVRKQLKDLPFRVTLDDSMAMGPMAKLSSFDQVEVIARVSKSGTPAPQVGDLEGKSKPVSTLQAVEELRLIIDNVVQ